MTPAFAYAHKSPHITHGSWIAVQSMGPGDSWPSHALTDHRVTDFTHRPMHERAQERPIEVGEEHEGRIDEYRKRLDESEPIVA